MKFWAFTFFVVITFGMIYKASYSYMAFFAHATWGSMVGSVLAVLIVLRFLTYKENWSSLNIVWPLSILLWIIFMHLNDRLPFDGVLARPFSNITFVFFGLIWMNSSYNFSRRTATPEKSFIINIGVFIFSLMLGVSFANSWTMAHIQWSEFVFLTLVLLCIALVFWATLFSDLRGLFVDTPKNTPKAPTNAPEIPALVSTLAAPTRSTAKGALDFLMESKAAHADLTLREKEVLDLLVAGKTRKTIAEELHISENTVKTHLSNIYGKFEVNTRAELLAKIMDRHEDV